MSLVKMDMPRLSFGDKGAESLAKASEAFAKASESIVKASEVWSKPATIIVWTGAAIAISLTAFKIYIGMKNAQLAAVPVKHEVVHHSHGLKVNAGDRP